MTARQRGRTARCTRAQALERLAQARTYLEAAALVADDGEFAGVAAALAVLSGIAAADAACCARLGHHHRGQDHRGAVDVLGTVDPGGAAMARDLQRLLDRKDAAHYGLTGVGAADERRMVSWARRLYERARSAVEA
ncbi:MAG: DNA-binding protein [Actinobacteria bacterium]|nr:DNA-binding protein [Actinomycetota bacterium]